MQNKQHTDAVEPIDDFLLSAFNIISGNAIALHDVRHIGVPVRIAHKDGIIEIKIFDLPINLRTGIFAYLLLRRLQKFVVNRRDLGTCPHKVHGVCKLLRIHRSGLGERIDIFAGKVFIFCPNTEIHGGDIPDMAHQRC